MMWGEITVRQKYAGSAHSQTETIFLRAPASLLDVLNVLDSVDMPAIRVFESALLPLMGQITEALRLRELARAMIVKLEAGGCITPHRDEGAYARYFARFHYVLTSTPECHFTVGDETVHMAPGELWWFNHQVVHHVENLGPDRIHLIFDATAPGFTGALGDV
jgi:quercetin dioxygenase-like cupin family protein